MTTYCEIKAIANHEFNSNGFRMSSGFLSRTRLDELWDHGSDQPHVENFRIHCRDNDCVRYMSQ